MRSDESDGPRAGLDYPRNGKEFKQWFAEETSCRAYLERLRWPEGFECPECGDPAAWRRSRELWQCATCGHETSVTAGTIFDRTHTPLSTWLAAAWHISDRNQGMSALELMRVLDLGGYQTAWSMLHKLRRTMVHSGRDRLQGDVEVDEGYIGPVKGGEPIGNRALVGIAAEVPKRGGIGRSGGIGRIRMAHMEDISEKSLTSFIAEAVEGGSTLRTDGAEFYRHLPRCGYVHRPLADAPTADPERVVMPAAQRVASLLKRWLRTTHKGAVSAKYLDSYLAEFTFRFNHRPVRRRGLLFYHLLRRAVEIGPVHHDDLVRDPED